MSAEIIWPEIPIFSGLLSVAELQRVEYALAGGDDYELCFTASAIMRDKLLRISADSGLILTRIGSMHAGHPQVRVCDARGGVMNVRFAGFDHFANTVQPIIK